MAAILQKVLEREVTANDLIAWLQSTQSEVSSLNELAYLKTEFVPFFLNYLRDQTSHLLQANRSSTNTPAKTPTTAKLKKLTSHPQDSQWPPPEGGKRLNGEKCLASTPLDRPGQCVSSNNRPVHHDRNSFSDSSFHKSGSISRKQGLGRGGRGGKSQRSIQFSTPADSHKNKNRPTSLADFIKSPNNDGRSQRSPQCHRKEEASPSPVHGRRSGNKHKGSHNADRKNRHNSQTVNDGNNVPGFNLNNSETDFPPMGSSEDKASNLPEGAKIITPSRRITTTLLSSTATTEDNALFKNAPIQTDTSKVPASRGVWGQVAARDFSSSDVCKTLSSRNQATDSKPKRRIAPTLISTKPAAEDTMPNVFTAPSIAISSSSDSNKDTEEHEQVSSTDGAMSSESPRKTPVKSKDPVLSGITPTKAALERMLSVDFAVAEQALVTNREILDIFVTIYSSCLSGFLVPNISVELYFLVQVLTARGGDLETVADISQEVDEIRYFSTIHNAVYFAVRVLSNQNSVLTHLDRGTLRMLIDNQRIADFLPDFRDQLCELYDFAPSKGLPKSLPSPIGGVSFQADTDNRKNFPSERAFNVFKKQRDTFYELLREWEENHLVPGWSMCHSQADRIQQLVDHRIGPANHIHFVRLFHSQLVQMCKGDSSWKKDEEDENIALLSELKQTNPKKLKRLRERLVTPAFHGGPCPSPSFPGCQEFFRDFIAAASNPFFNQHLCDILTVKIVEMNDMQLISVEVTYEEDEDIMIDVEDKETLLNCLLTSKLLAKFLGYVNFLPYSSPEVLPESLQTDYVQFRNKTSPPFAILRYIEECRVERRTVITIPWVVEYLTMMDSFASQLEYYRQVFKALLRVYRESSDIFRRKQNPSNFLVLAVLGWLFELPVFPQSLLFKDETSLNFDDGSRFALDNLGVVDQQILYSCCPYLGEIRSLLVDFAVGLSGRSSCVRKITPMSADVVDLSPATVSDKQLQHQLEDNFFHNHPASLRRTVDFVADRVSSNHIKVYRTRDLPSVLGQVPSLVQDLAVEIVQGMLETPTLKQRELMKSVDGSAAFLSQKAKSLCLETAPSYCGERSRSILDLMLPEETPEPVREVTALITYRHTLEKVNNWLYTQITSHMFRKELTSELEKQVKSLKKKFEMEECQTPSGARTIDMSAGTPGVLNTSGPDKSTSQTPLPPPQHKNFLFESPVRVLQDMSLKPKVIPEDSPLRLLINSSVMKPPGSPSAKNCMNLSFDTGDKSLGSRALSSKLSKLTMEVQASSPKKGPAPEVLSVTADGRVSHSELIQDFGRVNRAPESPAPSGAKTEHIDTNKIAQVSAVAASKSEGEPNAKSDTGNEGCLSKTVKQLPSPCKFGRSPSKKLNVSFHERDLDIEFEELASKITSVSPNKKAPKPCIVNHLPPVHTDEKTALQLPEGFCSPTEPLIVLKECVRAVAANDPGLTSAKIFDALDQVQYMLQHGPKEVVSLIVKMIAKLSVDLAFTAALRHPALITMQISNALWELWTMEEIRSVVDFSPALCPRHMKQILTGDFQHTKGYQALIGLVKGLLDRQLASFQDILKHIDSNLTNSYLQPNIVAAMAQILCDILSSLESGVLLQTNSIDLGLTFQKLYDLDTDETRKQCLMSEWKRLMTESKSCDSTRQPTSFTEQTADRKVLCATENMDISISSRPAMKHSAVIT